MAKTPFNNISNNVDEIYSFINLRSSYLIEKDSEFLFQLSSSSDYYLRNPSLSNLHLPYNNYLFSLDCKPTC